MTVGRIPNVEGGIQPTLLTTTGDIMYASSASNPARLGIGSSAQVLTVASGVPSWATPSSGGMTLLSTTTLSSGTTSITGISGIYNNLFVIVQGITVNTGAAAIDISPNGSAVISTYAFQHGSTNDSGISEKIKLSANQQIDNTGGLNAFALSIENYASTSYYKAFNWSGTFPSTGRKSVYGGGGIETTSAITQLDFICGSGRTFSGGQVLIYGVK